MEKYCIMCGNKMEKDDKFCVNCGSDQKPTTQQSTNNQSSQKVEVKQAEKSKIEAGILGIILGPIGIHNFYLGYTTKAIIQIIVTILTCSIGGLWGITEGVLILLGYIKEDADGNTLK